MSWERGRGPLYTDVQRRIQHEWFCGLRATQALYARVLKRGRGQTSFFFRVDVVGKGGKGGER